MKAKKSLGQNFLKSEKALSDIILTAEVSGKDEILEIGPGEGALTEKLLQKARRVVAVEKDDRLIPFLKEKFAEEIKSGKLNLVHRDILELNPSRHALRPNRYILVANIPYYITGLIFRKFLEEKDRPAKMVIVVQKEVAERIVGRDGKGSVLSNSVKVFGLPKLVKKISASCFSPKPKVDSAILLVENISSPFASPEEGEKFFEILKKGFAHKRKLLKKNLGVPGEKLSACGIDNRARPEELSVKDWLCLSSGK